MYTLGKLQDKISGCAATQVDFYELEKWANNVNLVEFSKGKS